MGEKIQLNQAVDPGLATVFISQPTGTTAPQGVEARFDLSSFPRIESMLVDLPMEHIADIVTKICGLCPVTHHLAVYQAWEHMRGFRPADIPPRAQAVRTLLHYGSVLDTVAPKLIMTYRQAAVTIKKAGKALQRAAGMEGHFPHVATVGGVLHDVTVTPELRAIVEEALDVARALPVAEPIPCSGGDLFQSDASGNWDPLGSHVRYADSAHCEVFPVEEFFDRVHERHPGEIVPRPYIDTPTGKALYRVGPRTHAGDGEDPWGIVEALSKSLRILSQIAETDAQLVGTPSQEPTRTGVGLVDGPRGVLAHAYEVDENEVVTAAHVLTPTAQNEPWLAELLTEACSGPDNERTSRAEAAIRAADPCMPCASMPPGMMNIEFKEEPCA
ncbi:hypothetical protein [Corynebacterium renale]|uniref:NAD-reducing hydrogenase large subunit n=1 Tax=Corynebacterium renale TaxID=1724 RepID=A0A2A9DP18_9CORY|nr:hypothetical protein [Corynebacterium renale]PFG28438.1 NAD-reducing hydrogenase large subunit [Corynebacterium renale]SQI26416.1 putative reducing hydrogenase alpha subunit [Corynebacterium renale]